MAEISQKRLLPENIFRLKPYIAGKKIEEIRDAYHPKQISKLASNENRLGCSPVVKEAVLKAINRVPDYPDPVSRDLRAALAKKNNVLPENVLMASGSESIIAILCRTFFRNNEEAITADATFVGFFVQANIQDIPLKKIPVTPDYRFDIEAIAGAITDRTKLIYIANPNNPTGTYITKKEFKRLMNQIPDDILVIMDEAYYEYADGVSNYPHALEYDFKNVISLRTFSKAYGLAGMRVGYAIGAQNLIAAMSKTKLTFEPSVLAQAAALAAIGDDNFLLKSKYMVKKGRERLYHFLDRHGVKYVRSVANSVMMICNNETQAEQFTQSMLEKGIILRHVAAYGLPQCVRITIGTKREMLHFERSFEEINLPWLEV